MLWYENKKTIKWGQKTPLPTPFYVWTTILTLNQLPENVAVLVTQSISSTIPDKKGCWRKSYSYQMPTLQYVCNPFYLYCHNFLLTTSHIAIPTSINFVVIYLSVSTNTNLPVLIHLFLTLTNSTSLDTIPSYLFFSEIFLW